MEFTLEQIAKATAGKIIQGLPGAKIRGVSTNSKTVRKGELFIAIRGERFDAHDFLPEVIGRGAAAVVISKNNIRLPLDVAAVKVKDTTRALGSMARSYRDRFSIPVIGITGSAGKTTTKEMMAHVLTAKFKVLRNFGTENNHIGVPLTLLKLKPSHDMVIVEMGTNRFGDIPWLVEVARPTMAILTNIGESHLAELKSPADVFQEKSALIKGTPENGIVIVNNDDPFLRTVPSMDRRHRVITYAVHSPADYQAQDMEIDARQWLHFRVNRKNHFVLRGPVPAFVYNALVAITCGRVFKINYNTIARQLLKFRPHAGRQGLLRVGSYYLIDDSYNANPVSFHCALETLACAKVKGRRIVCCGDMLELGDRSEELHRAVGALAAQNGVSGIFSFGKFARWMGETAREHHPGIHTSHSENIEEIQRQLIAFCRPGDAILVKGSRGMHMERVVAFLKKQLD